MSVAVAVSTARSVTVAVVVFGYNGASLNTRTGRMVPTDTATGTAVPGRTVCVTTAVVLGYNGISEAARGKADAADAAAAPVDKIIAGMATVVFGNGGRGIVTLILSTLPGTPVTVRGSWVKLGSSEEDAAVVLGYNGVSETAMGRPVPAEMTAPVPVPGSRVGAA